MRPAAIMRRRASFGEPREAPKTGRPIGVSLEEPEQLNFSRGAKGMAANGDAGVTIVTSTIRENHIRDIFDNFDRQLWPVKELIVIVNDNGIALRPYRELAQQYGGVRVFRVDESRNLGACLNFAVARASFPYIAKFDDDDYYSPHYLHEAMLLFARTNADVVGKRSCYFYFPHRLLLLLRKTTVKPYGRCRRIAGATIIFHKRVFRKVSFSTKLSSGTDARFVQTCLSKGFSVYTTSSYNFAAYRRANRRSHTWKVSEQRLLASKNAAVIRTGEFRPFIDRDLENLPLPAGLAPSDGDVAGGESLLRDERSRRSASAKNAAQVPLRSG